MFTVEIFHNVVRLRAREEELRDQNYEKPKSNERYYIKVSHIGVQHKVKFISRSFFHKINGLNPGTVKFHFIPNSEELALAHIRVLAKSGTVYVLGEER